MGKRAKFVFNNLEGIILYILRNIINPSTVICQFQKFYQNVFYNIGREKDEVQ